MIDSTLHPTHGLVVGKFTGVLTKEELLAVSLRAAASDPQPEKYALDFSLISDVKLDYAQMSDLVAAQIGQSAAFASARIGILALSTLTYGTARIYQQLLDIRDVSALAAKDIQSLADWLDVPASILT